MKTLILVYFALFILLASACNNGNGEASISNNADCISNPASCNSAIYQQNNGYTNYGGTGSPFYNNGNSNYLCNCPAGTMPTYNSYAGLGCVRTASYSSGLSAGIGLYGYLYVGWGTNHQLYAMPQLYRYNDYYDYNYGYNRSYEYGYNNRNCYNGAVQSCVVGQANNCPSGYACRQSGAQSTLGLCVTAYR